MSVRISSWVDFVTNVLPHAQVTLHSLYLGWIPSFMLITSFLLRFPTFAKLLLRYSQLIQDSTAAAGIQAFFAQNAPILRCKSFVAGIGRGRPLSKNSLLKSGPNLFCIFCKRLTVRNLQDEVENQRYIWQNQTTGKTCYLIFYEGDI